MRLAFSIIAAGLALLAPASAAAHGSGELGVRGVSEGQLRSFESRVLGPGHAAEHAKARKAARKRVRRARARRRAAARARARCLAKRGRSRVKARRCLRRLRSRARANRRGLARAAVEGDPAAIGRWGAPFSIPVMAINTTLLPTGKLLWFAYPKNPNPRYGGQGENEPNTAQAWLWDPATGTNKRVDPPLWRDPKDGQLKPANIWCAGQTLLEDGRVLVVGGNLAYTSGSLDFKGLNKAYTFNPWNETWTEQPDMRHGRWYPTAHRLSDGRVVILAGRDETGVTPGNTNKDVELFTPSAAPDGRGSMTLLGNVAGSRQPPNPGLYPHMFVMPSGRSLVAGPHPHDTWLLSPPGPSSAYDWLDVADASRDRVWDTAVPVPAGPAGSTRVMQIGGSASSSTTSLATPTTETIDESNLGAGWTATPALKVGRSHHNTVLLPDGSMVTVGGGVGIRNGDQWAADTPQKQIELWDAATGAWTLGPSQAEFRTYHSTAVLLPDGRVLSAGDDANGGIDRDTAEIYEPPYLFKGARPSIATAPGTIGVGQAFDVDTPDTNVTRAVLMAPGSTTHANDMNQRYVPLVVAARAGGVRLTAPANSDIAQPGWYMLFLVNSNGVPSVAKWVKLNGEPPLTGEDYARNRPATASSSNGIGAPGTVVDGNLTTRWASNSTDNQWWRVDLQSVRRVSRVELQWHPTYYATRYRIQTSTDGTTFSDAADVTIANGGLKPTYFPARDARYIRVLGVTRSTSAGFSLYEARVYGPAAGSPDTTPPQTTIDSGPSGTTTSTSASFGFSSSEAGSSFECKLDSGSFAPCTSPKAYSGLSSAAHHFEVRARDAAGNVDLSPATRDWTVSAPPDTTPPDTTITSGPTGTTSATDATFAFFADEAGSSFECKLDGDSFAPCTSPKTYTGLPTGDRHFEVRARDAAGNYDPSPATRDWTIAAAPPPSSYTTTVQNTPGLVGYWRFGELVGPTANPAAGLASGTYRQGVSLGQPGLINGDSSTAAVLGGTSDAFVTFGDLHDFAGIQAFSIEAWVRPTLVDGLGRRVFSKEWSNGSDQGWYLLATNTRLQFSRVRNGVYHNVNGPVLASGSRYHLVATYDGATMRLYVNGSLVGSAASSQALLDGPSSLTVGAKPTGYGAFVGTVDEPAVYSAALSAAQVQAHYSAGG